MPSAARSILTTHKLRRLRSAEQSVSGWASCYEVSLRFYLPRQSGLRGSGWSFQAPGQRPNMTTNHQLTETLDLKCLSPEQRATDEEMTTVKALLGRFDAAPSGSCSIVPPGASR